MKDKIDLVAVERTLHKYSYHKNSADAYEEVIRGIIRALWAEWSFSQDPERKDQLREVIGDCKDVIWDKE